MSLVDIASLYSPNPNNLRNFLVTYHDHRISTTVTATPSVVREWLFRIRQLHFHRIQQGSMVIGLGLQWDHTCDPAGGWNPPSTLQLCVGHRCLIFHIARAPRAPLSLRRFLSNPNIKFVTVSDIYEHGTLPRPNQIRLTVTKLVNFCDIVMSYNSMGAINGSRIPMDKLSRLVLSMEGVEKYPLMENSDWDAHWLSAAQVGYACVNASIAFFIGVHVKVWTWANHEGCIYDL